MKRLAAAAAALSLIAMPATAAPCLTQREAEAVTAAALPEVLRSAGITCGAALPATSLLRQPRGTLMMRYQAAADRAWPAARAALTKLSDPQLAPLLQSEFARPLLASLIAPLIVGRIEGRDCPTLDRLVTLVSPLPPENTAGIVVTSLRWMKREARAGRAPVANLPDLPICTAS